MPPIAVAVLRCDDHLRGGGRRLRLLRTATCPIERGGRERLPAHAVAPKGDGARGAARLGRRAALASSRSFSRTVCLRGPDGIKRVSPVNRRVQESGDPLTRHARGGETARTGSTALAETARASPATRGGAARPSSPEVLETARVTSATDHDPRQ